MDASDMDMTKVSEQIIAVSERAQKAAWDVEWLPMGDSDAPPVLYVWIPNGRRRRRQVIGLARAERLLSVPFEQYRLLGDYLAIDNASQGYIEVMVRSPAFGRRGIYDVPGVEIIERSSTDASAGEEGEPTDETVDVGSASEAIRSGAYWRLRIDDDRSPWSIEFSEASDSFIALSADIHLSRNRKPPTLKIRGISTPRHDEALRHLEEIGGAILFDLDLCYGIQLELARPRPHIRHYRPDQSLTRAPSLPRLRYPSQALSLYSYGRSAYGLPLLQFLAYYQVLEFFFPIYFRQSLLRRLRQELADPRFDVTDDAHLARLVATATSSGGTGYGSEREQLKATINGCVDESSVRTFLHEDPDRLQVIGDKKTIKGVEPVVDDGHHGNLIDQVGQRIYAIRCRVVHAKSDGGDMAVDLLLPGSSEAEALVVDVSVLQFLAQKAIVAGGAPLST
jgi:hypothetical protein